MKLSSPPKKFGVSSNDNDSSNESFPIVHPNTSTLSSNDSRSNTLYNTGQSGITSMTRSALLEPTYPDNNTKRHSDQSNPKSGSVSKKLEASGSNCNVTNTF